MVIKKKSLWKQNDLLFVLHFKFQILALYFSMHPPSVCLKKKSFKNIKKISLSYKKATKLVTSEAMSIIQTESTAALVRDKRAITIDRIAYAGKKQLGRHFYTTPSV